MGMPQTTIHQPETKHQWRRLAIAILIFALAVSAIGLWKYAHYRYGGMDLAIYTNVLHHLAFSPSPGEGERVGEGQWHSSIQGGSYLGDHIEPILLALAPLLRIWPDPRLLIILQALAIGLTAVPLFFLLRSSVRERWAMVLTTLWLFNPLLWNAALFEFHALAFAPFFLLSAAYFYGQRRFWPFIFFLFFSLSVREDVALIVAMFGVVAAVDRWRDVFSSSKVSPLPPQWRGSERGWVWIAAPLLLSLLWFFLATRIAAAHSPSGAYKFLVYYGWIRDVGSHPLTLLKHFASIGNLDMALGLLLPFLFLPLLRPRWLLLAVPPLLQILLAEPGGSNVVVELHYGLLFVPALALASVETIQTFSPPPLEGEREGVRLRSWFAHRFPLPKPFAIGLGIATYIAAAWMLGPFPGIANAAIRGASSDERVRAAAYDEFLQIVQSRTSDKSGISIAAGYAALPHIAARARAYALPYAYLGVNQYAFAPYELPDDLQFVLLDQRDALAYAVQFPSVRWSAPYAAEGPQRLRTIIVDGRFGIVAERDGVALLERGAALAASDGIDQRYLAPDHSVRGRLIVDSLRDIVVQRD